MFPATPASKHGILLLLGCVVALASAGPADEQVERYLRGSRMDQLLEVHLESRLEHAESDEERAAIGETLSDLYLRQLRELDRTDQYRQVVLIRARTLVDRLGSVPLHELRLELLIDRFLTHENSIELHQLLLLDEAERALAIAQIRQGVRDLDMLVASIDPDIERLKRRRTRTVGFSEQQEDDEQLATLQRLSSLGHYYQGWGGYGLAVLEDMHVGREPFIAFGWLLGAEGGLPQSKDLPQAATEYEHVARSAIGVAMCYAQSEDTSLSSIWLRDLIENESVPPQVREDAQTRLLRVLAMGSEWYDALVQANLIFNESGDDRISVADARFITIMALTRPPGAASDKRQQLAKLGIEQLIAQREIGHVVDLYKRFDRLPMLREGFIPNYARALAELERAEAEERSPQYLTLGEQFNEALKARDADAYPEQRDDCRLKLAYTLIRADRPGDAIRHCQAILESSIDEETLEEARWVCIAALDKVNTLANKPSSDELDLAVREYVESYPSSDRTAKLVLRHAMRGTLDDQLAIDSLRAVDPDDPIAIPARRTLLQLQYQILRRIRFSDQPMLDDTRGLALWLIDQQEVGKDEEWSPQNFVGVLQIAIDLALRDTPPDAAFARKHIERARSMIGSQPSLQTIEAEMLMQLLRAEMIDDRFEAALAVLDELRAVDPSRANDAQMLVLNILVDQWSIAHSPRVARLLVDVGSPVIARVAPRSGERITVQTSALMEVIAEAALTIAEEDAENPMLELAYRFSKQVLNEGQPSEPGLRRTAELATTLSDTQIRLEAWLRLLAAYPQDDHRWYEARYESLAAMQLLDPARAFDTFKQFRVLNPSLGPAPWNQRIAGLFAEQAHGGDGP